MKVVIYRRLSKKTEGNQYGFDSQDHDLQNWLSQNPESEIVGEFGEFYSGRGHFSKRPEFNKALRMCKELGATLIVNKPDRLARDVESGAHILNHYDVIFTNYPDADRLTKHILLTVAQAESDNTSARVTAALKVAKSKGVKLGGSNPKWKDSFDSNKSRHISKSNHEQSQDLWESKRSVIEGVLKVMRTGKIKLTYKNIADNLNLMNVTTPKGGEFTPSQSKRALSYLNLSR